jgi:hypothetical protein
MTRAGQTRPHAKPLQITAKQLATVERAFKKLQAATKRLKRVIAISKAKLKKRGKQRR